MFANIIGCKITFNELRPSLHVICMKSSVSLVVSEQLLSCSSLEIKILLIVYIYEQRVFRRLFPMFICIGCFCKCMNTKLNNLYKKET